MIKDGLADKTRDVLHRAYDHILKEPIPPRLTDLLNRLQ